MQVGTEGDGMVIRAFSESQNLNVIVLEIHDGSVVRVLCMVLCLSACLLLHRVVEYMFLHNGATTAAGDDRGTVVLLYHNEPEVGQWLCAPAATLGAGWM